MALLLSAALLFFVFTFSLLVLLPMLIIGALVIGLQLWKMKRLHKEMSGQAQDGRIIEGEVISETAAAERLESDSTR